MIIEDIITSLERYVHKVNPDAVLVIQKEIEPCRLKVFKTIRYTLWLIDKLRKKKFPILVVQLVEKIDSPESEERAIRTVEMQFMTALFEFIRGEEFNLILGGSYEGDEQVSDSID